MAYTSSHGNVGHGHGYEDEEDRNQSRDRMTFGLLAELAERLTCGFTCGSRQESFMREETPGSSVMGVSGRGGVMQPGQENVHPMEFGRPGHFVRSSVQSGNGLGGRAVAYDGSVTSRQVSSLMTPGAPCLKGGGVGGGGGGTLGGEAKGILRSRASTMVPEDDAPLVTMGRGDFEGTGRWGADGGGTERRGRTQRGSVSSVDDWSLDGESEMASLRAQHAQREAEEFRRRELERYYQSRLEFAHTDPVVKYEASILHAASSNLREKTILR